MTSTSPKSPSMTFSGFKSRWMTPCDVGEGDGVGHLHQDFEVLGERLVP